MEEDEISNTYIKGTFQPEFNPPAPGTYQLPPIQKVKDHPILTDSGKKVGLLKAKQGKLALISFIYTTCPDPAGCPLATSVLQEVDKRISQKKKLAGKVHLMSLSFDPERDTPSRMKEWKEITGPRTNWGFYTTRGETEAQAVLEDFRQQVNKTYADDGSWTGMFRHVLKVYLLDRENNVRNIYSVGLFSPDLVINDIETVLLDKKK
jgi:cytochrome c peroxidase